MKKKICIVSGSRADYGLLQWPIKVLQEDDTFDVDVAKVDDKWSDKDLLLVLGDRLEIMETVLYHHLKRISIAHIGGGDVTLGSYDDAMRDCISRMATYHFTTSHESSMRLAALGYTNIHMVGNPGIDYIRHADWKTFKRDDISGLHPPVRPIEEPYVVINYQAETIDGTVEIRELIESLDDRKKVFILPNPDRGSDQIKTTIYWMCKDSVIHESLLHDEYLNLIYHCDELIGNSSSMLYEAPELGVKTKMIGKRQKGRVIPEGDGKASERILNILKYTL